MSKRYKGAILSSTPPTTSTSSASGVWTEQQFMQGVATGNWPALAGAPTIGTATATGATTASVTFTAPAYTGSGITGYTAISSPGGITGTGASSPVTVSGLTEGTAYTFTVTATTAGGQGPASAASNSVTPVQINYIEEVFSTYLYAGNSSTQTITNNINLSGNGGLVWIKYRNFGDDHVLFDTARGATNYLISNSTSLQSSIAQSLTSFNSNGFSLGSSSRVNGTTTSPANYVSWTFRKQPKFFDVVTWTGNGVGGRQIPHNLGSVPGCLIVKVLSEDGGWRVWHRAVPGDTNQTSLLALNTTDPAELNQTNVWAANGITSTYFTASTSSPSNINGSGNTYVAYLFAHNAGGFGLTGTDDVISCGSYTTDGSGNFSVNLGYEPQWIMAKRVSSTGDWTMFDTMRGLGVDGTSYVLYANVSNAESGPNSFMSINSTGFGRNGGTAGQTFIYIAIRRGPMKVPTSGTSVFSPNQTSATTGTQITTGFPVDWQLVGINAGNVQNQRSSTRLTGVNTDGSSNSQYLITSNTNAEAATGSLTLNWGSTGFQVPSLNSGSPTIFWNFRRSPSVFDVVCFTGTGTDDRQVAHNLGVAPELIICKSRSAAWPWWVGGSVLGSTSNGMFFNTTGAIQDNPAPKPFSTNGSAFTSSYFLVSSVSAYPPNANTYTQVAYLFATCPGVSKVGSFSGTGATQTIDCGFSGGARWVLIKRTDSTGDWYVWDTARGMVSGTDPSLLLNSTAAEVNANSVYTATTGFQIVSTAAGINASGGTYIFLAIA